MGFALCGLLLTGCRAEGTFDILSEERVAVDLVVSGPDVDCPDGVYGLTLSTTAVTDTSGLRACHVFGESQAAALHQFGIYISTAAEYLVLQTNLSLGFTDLPASDIQIRFPGQVVTATKGTVIGNAVHITDLAPLARGSGMRVIGLSRPAPPAWMVAAAIGTGSGVVGTLLILGLVWLARRRRPLEPQLIAAEPTEAAALPRGHQLPPVPTPRSLSAASRRPAPIRRRWRSRRKTPGSRLRRQSRPLRPTPPRPRPRSSRPWRTDPRPHLRPSSRPTRPSGRHRKTAPEQADAHRPGHCPGGRF